MWIVAEGQDWEGDYEHIGPFDSEAEATEYATHKQQAHNSKHGGNGYLKWYAVELKSPDDYDKERRD